MLPGLSSVLGKFVVVILHKGFAQKLCKLHNTPNSARRARHRAAQKNIKKLGLSLGEHPIHRHPQDSARSVIRDLDHPAGAGIVNLEDLAGEDFTAEVIANSHCIISFSFFFIVGRGLFLFYNFHVPVMDADVDCFFHGGDFNRPAVSAISNSNHCFISFFSFIRGVRPFLIPIAYPCGWSRPLWGEWLTPISYPPDTYDYSRF